MKHAFIGLKAQFIHSDGVKQLSIDFTNMDDEENFILFHIVGGGVSMVAKDAILVMRIDEIPDKNDEAV